MAKTLPLPKFIQLKQKRVIKAVETLQEKKERLARLREEARALREDIEYHEKYLQVKVGQNFTFIDDEGYVKRVEFTEHERRYLDQAKAKKLLGTKTPYRVVTVRDIKVDYVYED